MMSGNGQLSVPPGFRFHPTDEELLYYYLRKKVSYEAIDLDVIREVDLNKLEPWDLKEKCRIGSGPQNEWYFFSHKDKKYPTGTRTNRATTAGFWKATGRDKSIHLNTTSKRIGMRKTLVFYTGRAPHGQKTDWIMHEYRLDDDNSDHVQEDGWVVCRVFKKKNQTRGFLPDQIAQEDHEEHFSHVKGSASTSATLMEQKQSYMHPFFNDYTFDGSMHLPQLFSPESAAAAAAAAAAAGAGAGAGAGPSFISPNSLSSMDIECSQNLLRLTSTGCGLVQPQQQQPAERFSGDWSFLDKLLASHHSHQGNRSSQGVDMAAPGNLHQKFPFPYLGCEPDILRFSK